MSYEQALGRVKEISSSVSAAKAQDILVTKALFSALSVVYGLIVGGTVQESILIAPVNLAVLEDLCSNKLLVFGQNLQNSIVSIYSEILRKCAGFAVRNVITSMLGIVANKLSSVSSRDCAMAVIGSVMESRSFDCGSMINDVIACFSRATRANEVSSRSISFRALTLLINGAGARISDCHQEILKTASRCNADRNVDVRTEVAALITAIARHSSGCSSVPPEVLVAAVQKGLEDENAVVQDGFVRAYAATLSEQFRAYLEAQEKAKIGLARGGSAEAPAAAPKRRMSVMNMPKLNITAPKKLAEDFQFRTVVGLVLKNILKTTGLLRNGYIAALSYFIRESLIFLEQSDLEWFINSVLDSFRDPAMSLLTYEEIVYFRARISSMLSTSIAKQLNETRLLGLASILISYVANMETRGESELQVALGELCHVLLILGEASIAIADEIQAAVVVHLRNASFCVRSASAHVICSLATCVPGICSTLLRASIHHAKEQAKHLSRFEVFEISPGNSSPVGTGNGPPASGAAGSLAAQAANNAATSVSDAVDDSLSSLDPNRRRNPKEAERLQRMYFFHGHTLVISMFLKSEIKFASGIPNSLVTEIFDFGLELLRLNVLNVPQAVRNVACSMIRAGSLVVSSCLNRGYVVNKQYVLPILDSCDAIFKQASSQDGSGSNSPKPNPANSAQATAASAAGSSVDDLLFELMSVEAALVCISTLLWSCPGALEHEEGCLPLVIDGLERSFRLVKHKYQAKFRAHFRFRILHAIVLECFAWLPPGSFPNTCQQVFVESLRVFRDSIGANSECSCLSELVGEEYATLNLATANSSAANALKLSGMNSPDIPATDDLLLLRLESYAVVLPKKESEALLAFFNKDHHSSLEIRSQYLPGLDWRAPRPPCFLIESRTIDAAIAAIAITFGHQSIEFQEKCVNLCLQMLTSLSKSTTTMSMFISDEEKRRKERKSFVTIKGVIACLHAIIKSFPFDFFASPSFNLSWSQSVADSLVELSTHACLEIKIAASQAVAHLASKMTRSSLLDTVFSRVSSALSLAGEKKGETMESSAGSLLLLAELWMHATSRPSLQKTIFANLLECLRRTEFAVIYRANGFASLNTILRASTANLTEIADTITLLERTAYTSEINLVSVAMSEDAVVMYASLVRVCATASVVLMKIAENATTDRVQTESCAILSRFMRIWEIIRYSCPHPTIRRESIALLDACCSYTLFRNTLGVETISSLVSLIVDESFSISDDVALSLAVATIVRFSEADAETSYKFELDVLLYKIFIYSISSTACPTTLSYTGLDIRCCSQLGLNFVSDQAISKLAIDAEMAIEAVHLRFALVNMDTNAMRSILFNRAVSLGLRTSSHRSKGNVEQESAEQAEGEADEDDGPPAIPASTAKSTSTALMATIGARTGPSWNVQQYSSHCRDVASIRSNDIPVGPLRVKCFAIKLCATILNRIQLSVRRCTHGSVKFARESTRISLAPLGSAPTDEDLQHIPCFASLFVHDLVNLACASATHTINDKVLSSLQTDSIAMLEQTVCLFFTTSDPDAQGVEPDAPAAASKILQQFISQILSSVRPCLGTRQTPSLALLSGKTISHLIRGGLLADKIAVRRLIKHLFGGEEKSGEDSGMQCTEIRARLNPDTSDTFSAINHIVESSILALLFVLSTSSVFTFEVENAVKSTLLSLIQGHLTSLTQVWFGMVIDAARVLQSTPSRSVEEESTVAPLSSSWSITTIETDPRRGGSTYPPTAACEQLKVHFERLLPIFLAALVSSPHFQPVSQLEVVFTVVVCELQNICSRLDELSETANSVEFTATSQVVSNLPCLLLALSKLARVDQEFSLIPKSEWMRVLELAANKLWPCITKFQAGSDLVQSQHHIVDLVTTLFCYLPTPLSPVANPSPGTPQKQMKALKVTIEEVDVAMVRFGLWKLATMVLRSLFPSTFARSSVESSDVQTNSMGGIPRVVDPISSLSSEMPLAPLVEFLLASADQNPKDFNSEPLSRLVRMLVALAKELDPSFREFIIRVLLSSIPLNTLCCVTQPRLSKKKDAVFLFMISQILEFNHPTSDNTNATVLGEAVQGDLLSWHILINRNSQSSSPLWMTGEAIAAVTESLMFTWKAVCASASSPADIVKPLPAAAITLQTSKANVPFMRAFFACVLNLVQTDATRTGTVLLEVLFPAVLAVLSSVSTQMIDSSVELALVQFIFLGFNAALEARRSAFVTAIVPPLCEWLVTQLRRPNALESQGLLFVGKGMTLLARTVPDAFREVVASIGETQRTALQQVMRIVLQQQANEAAAATTGAAATTPTVKKIDMSRYKA